MAEQNNDSIGEGFSNHPHLEADSTSSAAGFDTEKLMQGIGEISGRFVEYGSQVLSSVKDIPVNEYASRVDRQVRASPWLHIGLVGAGSLAVGYLFGRGSSSRQADLDNLSSSATTGDYSLDE